MTEPGDAGPPRPAFEYITEYMAKRRISKYTFAEEIRYSVDHVEHILGGKRAISHECAWAIGKAFPALRPLGLLVAQAKWWLHQLDHPEPGMVPGTRPGPRRNPNIDPELVKRLYKDRSVTIASILEQTGASLSTMYRIIDDALIPRRGTTPPKQKTTRKST